MSAVLPTSANRADAAGLSQGRYYVHQDYCWHGRLVVEIWKSTWLILGHILWKGMRLWQSQQALEKVNGRDIQKDVEKLAQRRKKFFWQNILAFHAAAWEYIYPGSVYICFVIVILCFVMQYIILIVRYVSTSLLIKDLTNLEPVTVINCLCSDFICQSIKI